MYSLSSALFRVRCTALGMWLVFLSCPVYTHLLQAFILLHISFPNLFLPGFWSIACPDCYPLTRTSAASIFAFKCFWQMLPQPGNASIQNCKPSCSCSVQFTCLVLSDSLRPRGLQHTRLPYPPPTPGAYSNSCPLSRCCHPTISSSVIPFSSHLHSFPASGSFPMSQFFTSGQSIGISGSASVLPMNTQD